MALKEEWPADNGGSGISHAYIRTMALSWPSWIWMSYLASLKLFPPLENGDNNGTWDMELPD